MKRSFKKIVKSFINIMQFLFFRAGWETKHTAAPITLKTLFVQKCLGFNRSAYWPMHYTSSVSGAKNIQTGIGTAPGLSIGCYIQGDGKIIIGDYTTVGPNVGIISSNHVPGNISQYQKGCVKIGAYCWLGMNSVVLPNVELGDFVVVGAGAIVTKSFPEGYCIIGGNPAKLIRKLNPEECVRKTNKYEYIGYYKKLKFKKLFPYYFSK